MVVVNNVLLGRYWLHVTPGDALYLFYYAGWQKGMLGANNVLLGRYWPHVGPQEALFTSNTAQGGRREWWW
jgi:hypothetical protein